MSTTQPTEGNLYHIDGAGEPLVFSRIGGTGLAILHPPGEPDTQSSCAVEVGRLVPVATAPNPHDALRAASFIPLVKCSQCGANVAHWIDRIRALAACNGCGALTTCKAESGYALASEAGEAAADAWGEAHELAALERLFEIGLAVLRSVGLHAGEHVARNLAARSTRTQQEFTTSLASVGGFGPVRVAVEVAHVYRMVAEGLAP